jgi:tetratricopeptide (TPR) repeat protein
MNDGATLKSILLLAANPKGTVSLRLHEEERKIRERLRLAGYGKVPISSAGATRPRDIQQAMLDFKPQIVHFTGHGEGKDGLAFEDTAGQLKLVDSEALANLFKLFSNRVECVVLNACYSDFQAEAISQYIDYVIGMSQAIGDRAAIEFSVGFYAALGAGESIEFAYKLGCNAIQLEGIPEHLTPVLFMKKNESTSTNPQSLTENISSQSSALITAEPSTAEATLKCGKEKYDSGDYQGASMDFSEAIRIKQDYADAYNNRGWAKYKLKDYRGAIIDFGEAIRLNQNYANSYKGCGWSKYQLADYQSAIIDFNQAIRLQSGDPDAYDGRGWAKLEFGDKQGAIADFNQAIYLELDYAYAYYGRGSAKFALEDKKGAIVDLNEAIRLKQDFAFAYCGRGCVKLEFGDKSGAIADYNEAIRIQPDYSEAYYGRAGVKFVLGDEQGAIADLQEVMRLCQQQGDAEAYCEALEQIEKLKRKSKGFWRWLFS